MRWTPLQINCGASESFSSKGRWRGRSPGGVLPCLAVSAALNSSPLPAPSTSLHQQQRCSVSIARKHSGSDSVCPAVHRPAGHSGVWGPVLWQFRCLLLQTFSLDEALAEVVLYKAKSKTYCKFSVLGLTNCGFKT